MWECLVVPLVKEQVILVIFSVIFSHLCFRTTVCLLSALIFFGSNTYTLFYCRCADISPPESSFSQKTIIRGSQRLLRDSSEACLFSDCCTRNTKGQRKTLGGWHFCMDELIDGHTSLVLLQLTEGESIPPPASSKFPGPGASH